MRQSNLLLRGARILAIYLLAYLALVRAAPPMIMSGPGPWGTQCEYLVDIEVIGDVFYPAHLLDLQLRPWYWDDMTIDDFKAYIERTKYWP